MAHDALLGMMLANFRIDRRLGQGGMAVVYLGMDMQLDRPVAIKLINAQFQSNPAYAERFVAEAKIVARWRHESIISVYYADKHDDLYYFVMEYIDGATLEDLLRRYLEDGELMPHDDVIRIGRAVARGLDYAHKQGVVHRDVKPSNIMISRDDRVVVTDFGLALDMSQGSMGEIFGTPHYVAPEQVRHSADANPQSDLYSLGIALYEVLTGALPFDDPSPTAIAMQHLTEPPPPPTDVNPALNRKTEEVLLKALEKEPQDRYQTASEFIDALEDALQSIEADAPNPDAIMLPAAITKKNHNQARVSQVSISDMIAMELAEKTSLVSPQAVQQTSASINRGASFSEATETMNVSDRPQAPSIPEKKKNNMPLYLGIGAIGVVIVIIIFAVMTSGSGNQVDIEGTSVALSEMETQNALVVVPTETDIPTETDSPTATSTASEVVAQSVNRETELAMSAVAIFAQQTQTAAFVVSNAPTDDIAATVAVINVTNDAIATSNSMGLTATSNALAASNAQLEATLTQQALAVNSFPTELYPTGRLLELTYNSAGFYLRNSSSSRVRDSRLAFQAIDANGSAVSQVFNGVDWARFYNFIDGDGRCVVIELTDQGSWNRPSNCVSASGSQFNSQLSFPDSDGRIFWTGANAAVQFIVYWDNSEIARCTIANGYCQVRVGE